MSQPHFDADAYLAWEAEQPERSEYVAGEVFAMVGVRRTHATVALNIGAALREHLRGSQCLPFIADMKLRVAAADAFFYPIAARLRGGTRLPFGVGGLELADGDGV
jgi:Uma2 family endonuclease